MKTFTTEIKIGLFTIFSFFVIGYMFFVLNPNTFNGKTYKSYHTLVDDASGIIENTNVFTNGVVVGKVKDIKLVENNKTRIDFEVKQFVKIPEGSKAAIKEKGLLGDVYLEVLRSPDRGQYIKTDGYIEIFQESMGIGKLTTLAGSIGKDVKKVSTNFAKVLGSEEGEKDLKEIILSLKESLSLVRDSLNNNSKNINSIIKNTEAVTANINKILGKNTSNINEITQNIKEISKNLVSVTKTAKNLFDFDEKDSMKGVVDSIKKTSINIELASNSIKNIAQNLDEGEGTLGKLINDDKIIYDIEEGISSINEMISPARKLQINVDYHGEYRAQKGSQHFVNLTLRTRPDMFYLLGITNTYKDQTYTQLEIDKSTSDTSKDINKPHDESKLILIEEKALRFNLQIGKRWRDLELRLGLFESTGGIAADYYLFKDRIKLGVEAYEWNISETSHFDNRKYAFFRTYLNINLLSNLYVIGGLNDFSKEDAWKAKKYPLFIGAGFNFSDKDLKSILGISSLAR